MIEQNAWNHRKGERKVTSPDRFESRMILTGLAIAVATIIAFSLVLWAVLAAIDAGPVSESMASFAGTTSFFVGFLAGGFYVATHATRDKFLQTTGLVVAGFVVAAIGTILDLSFGYSLGNLMPGADSVDAMQIHVGFWVISWVAVPTAAFVAASVVPRGGQDWGTQSSEPEDTEL
ncbi:MAG: hypothetical protein H7287_06545 [Thermoleophilia bacterium]|nr:hypothetical protein [Thermoleophilia bacterium]